jgi:hypothetical protein
MASTQRRALGTLLVVSPNVELALRTARAYARPVEAGVLPRSDHGRRSATRAAHSVVTRSVGIKRCPGGQIPVTTTTPEEQTCTSASAR